MNLEQKEFLIKGRKDANTQEKIRIKLRYLLNKHSKASIFLTDFDRSKLIFHGEKEGFKAGFVIYKSSSEENVRQYVEFFNDLYSNEMNVLPDDHYLNQLSEDAKSFQMIIAFKKLKKSF